MRIHHDEHGQTILLVALSLPIMLGFIGVATDLGSLFKDKRTIQTAADAAAIAGALNLSNGTWNSAALAASATNGFTNGSNGVTVTVNNGPTWSHSNYLGQSGYIEATVVKSEPTIFLALFGYPSVNVLARAVATNQAAANGCVYTLGTTGTDLYVQGSPGIDAPNCAFSVGSSSSNAISEIGNGGSIITSSISAVGNIGTSGFGDFSPKPVGNAIPVSDPLAGMQYPYSCSSAGCTCTNPTGSTICSTNPIPTASMPTTCPAVSFSGVPNKGTLSLSPGCYDLGGASGTSIPANKTLSLSNGVYFFTDGALSMGGNSTFDATNVTMIMTDTATINMVGTPNLDLTAPGSDGTFPNILYYQVPADTQALTLQGSSAATITGVFYAPAAPVTMKGTAGGTINTEFVVSTLSLAGNPTIGSLAVLPGGASNGLHSIALVE